MARVEEGSFRFQADWFSKYIPEWEGYVGELRGLPGVQFLEIGSFEGRSTVWTLANILTHPTSRITCVDTFGGSMEHGRMGLDTTTIEDTFWHNIRLINAQDRVNVVKGRSQEVLRRLPFNTYDFAYIDGSHVAADVLTDAVLTYPLVKKGGIILFDDYYWDGDPGPLNQPKMAIKAFLSVFEGKYDMVNKGEQVAIRVR